MANFNFNKVILGGRLATIPEVKQTKSNKTILRGTIAISSKAGGEEKADFIRFTAWEDKATFISRFFDKGSAICIVGELRNNAYTDKDGVQKSSTEVNVSEVYFVDSKSERAATTANNIASGYGYDPYATATKNLEPVKDISAKAETIVEEDADDDFLPF